MRGEDSQTKRHLTSTGVPAMERPSDVGPHCPHTQRKRQQEFRQHYGPDYRSDLDLIFANPDGTPLKPDSVSSSASLLCRRLKLPKGVSLHTLRHSHGSHLLAAGMEITAVSERLGHSSVRVTADVYSHAIRGRDDEAARRWEEFQGRNLPEKHTGVQ
jgi:integrase